ncbi:hypothetical protein AGMMS49944_30720 [Spirochaetia bacterium]|nr:hypothetical protein AGMMS49944_30720 [Spirochaetia bacterium]
MKLDKMVLLGMFGMALIFGVVLPQNVKAADEAGMERLDFYMDNVIYKAKELSKEGVDEIEKIIRKDGKVDKDEYNYIDNVLHANKYYDNKILSSEARQIIQAIHDDYVYYYNEVPAKYPELINIGSKLPLDLRGQINHLVSINNIIKEYLSGNKGFNVTEHFWNLDATETANNDLIYIKDLLKKLQDALPTSPYKEILTKIYNAETRLFNENLKKFSER